MVAFYENKERDIFFRKGHSLHFPAHLHNHIELVYMLEGETITYVDGHMAHLKKGDIFISFPNQIHQYISNGPENYLLFIFSPDLLKDMTKIFKNHVPRSQVIKDADKHPCLFTLLSSVVDAYQSHNTYRSLQIKGYLLAFFSELLQLMELTSIKTSNLSTLQTILTYCSENYTKDLSLDTVAESLHMSKYYISHLLKRKINLGFTDYVNSLRVSEACRLLISEDISITDIASLVGFNTIRTFNRAFVKEIGVTPTSYRKNS